MTDAKITVAALNETSNLTAIEISANLTVQYHPLVSVDKCKWKGMPNSSIFFVFWPSIKNRTSKWTCIASWHEIRNFLLYVNATVISSIRTSVSTRGIILETCWYLLITEILQNFFGELHTSVNKSWMHNKLHYEKYVKNLQRWLDKAQNQITSQYVWKLAKVKQASIHLATANYFALIHGCMAAQCCGRTISYHTW